MSLTFECTNGGLSALQLGNRHWGCGHGAPCQAASATRWHWPILTIMEQTGHVTHCRLGYRLWLWQHSVLTIDYWEVIQMGLQKNKKAKANIIKTRKVIVRVSHPRQWHNDTDGRKCGQSSQRKGARYNLWPAMQVKIITIKTCQMIWRNCSEKWVERQNLSLRESL